MENNKIKLSSDLLFVKIAMCILTIVFLRLVINDYQNPINVDFKTSLEYKLYFLFSLTATTYFFIIPSIYYDDHNFYVKRVSKKEIVIPLNNIKSIFENPLSTSKGSANFSVEYVDNTNDLKEITFRAPYASKKTSNFIDVVKKINPKVKIIV